MKPELQRKFDELGAVAAAIANHAAADARRATSVSAENEANDQWVEMAEALIAAAPWLLAAAEAHLKLELAAEGITPGPWSVGTYFGPGAYIYLEENGRARRIAATHGPDAVALAKFFTACRAVVGKEA